MGKNLSHKHGQKLLDSAKKSTTDAIKTVSKIATQKTAEATGDWIGSKIADKVTRVSKKSTEELPNDEKEVDVERATHKKKYISPGKRQQIIDELRLAPKKMYIFRNYWWINVNVTNTHISRRKTTNYWWINFGITI